MRRNDNYLPAQHEQRGLTPYNQGGGLQPSSFFSASPWQLMRRMQEDMDRVFSQFFGNQSGSGTVLAPSAPQWAPSVDISQTDKEWCIEAELPGVSKDNIDVQVHDDPAAGAGRPAAPVSRS